MKSGITHRFAYDHASERVSYFNGTATTTYPNDYYDTQGATTTKHIYAQGALIATIEKSPATTTPVMFMVHTDHLGGTGAVTDGKGLLMESITYRPFGTPRVDQMYGAFSESRKYIGEEYDEETDLSYLNARYYEGSRGQFLSQDPVFWEMGQGTEDSVAVLKNPQAQNSYSYGQNNPIVNKDPDGRIAFGFGFSGTGNLPGMFGEGSGYAVITISSGSGIEVGIISSVAGGGSTSVGGAGGTAGLLISNARNISELTGPDAVFGGSGRLGLDVGVDVSLSKVNNSNRRIVTATPSVGLGYVGTPYVLPVEVHGGGGYTKAVTSVNITQGVKNVANSAKSSLQNQLNNISRQIKEIQKQIDKLKSKK